VGSRYTADESNAVVVNFMCMLTKRLKPMRKNQYYTAINMGQTCMFEGRMCDKDNDKIKW
jgi:hypothetical protein